MRAVVFTSRAEAETYERTLRAAHGIPEDGSGRPGVRVGGGLHATDAEGRTYRYAELRKHPAREEWAVSIAPNDVDDLPTGQALARLVSARMPRARYDALVQRLFSLVELGPDWFPAPF